MSTARNTLGLGAVLVRPDGVVAWACDAGGDASGLASSLERWFGPPRRLRGHHSRARRAASVITEASCFNE